MDDVSHLMNGNIWTLAWVSPENYIKAHRDINVRWCKNYKDGEDSFFAALKVFSDRSETSLGANSVVFYPIHLKLLNFTEEWCRKHIKGGNTIVAFLHIRHENIIDERLEKEGEEKNSH